MEYQTKPYKLPTTPSTIVVDTASLATDAAVVARSWTVSLLLPASFEFASSDLVHLASSKRTPSGMCVVVLATRDPLSFKDLPPIKLSYKPLQPLPPLSCIEEHNGPALETTPPESKKQKMMDGTAASLSTVQQHSDCDDAASKEATAVQIESDAPNLPCVPEPPVYIENPR